VFVVALLVVTLALGSLVDDRAGAWPLTVLLLPLLVTLAEVAVLLIRLVLRDIARPFHSAGPTSAATPTSSPPPCSGWPPPPPSSPAGSPRPATSAAAAAGLGERVRGRSRPQPGRGRPAGRRREPHTDR
jgi:hypothetical protein